MHNWTPPLDFAARLVLLRHFLGATVEEIARACDIPPATWSTWEHGTHPHQMMDKVNRIAAATGCSRDWLAFGEAHAIAS